MCAVSDAKIEDKNVALYMGYYEGKLMVDGVEYVQDQPEGKEKMVKALGQFSKAQLIDLLIQLVDNSEEG